MTTPAGSTARATPQVPLDRVQLGRLTFTTGTRDAAIASLRSWFRDPERTGTMVGFINPHVYNSAVVHPEVAGFLRDCRFVCIDGVGVSVAARIMAGTALPRVVATSLFEEMLGSRVASGGLQRPIQAVLIGTTAFEVSAAATAMNARLAGLEIAATMDGFRDLGDYDSLFRAHPDIDAVLVGAGAPQSERILLRSRAVCRRALGFHIGAGTIKLYAGTKRRAPRLMSRLGLEWVHRIVFEPHTRPRYGPGAVAFVKDVIATRHGEEAR